MGGSIEDDSTDEKAIGDMANQIAEIAQETQGEATRWASKKKDNPKDDDSKKNDDPKKKEDPKDDPSAKKIEDMEKELETMKKEQAAKDRESTVTKALDKHGIPAWRRKGTSLIVLCLYTSLLLLLRVSYSFHLNFIVMWQM